MVNYQYYNSLSIHDLFRRFPGNGLLTTNFEMLVHGLYWDALEHRISEYTNDIHIMHEYNIIEILNKFSNDDLKLISDPNRQYFTYRKYLAGETGLMSSLIINAQYILYEYLLSKGCSINIKVDTFLIFMKLISTDFNSIPIEELSAIHNIIDHYKYNYQDADLLNFEWWSNFMLKYNNILKIASTKIWFTTPILFIKMITNYGSYYLNEYLDDDWLNYGNWEYNPPFSNYSNHVDMVFINKIKDFFIS
jgi:hypothetical protein